MAKCEICSEKVQENFLNKLKGTVVKVNGKLKSVCMDCQKKLSIEEIKEKLK